MKSHRLDPELAGAEVLRRGLEPDQLVICDKGFAGREFEELVRSLGATLLRPHRRNEPRRFGALGSVRQWVESTFQTMKGQLSLERHGGRTLAGVVVRVGQRLLALAAALLHNQLIGAPGRHLVAYDHCNGINHLVAHTGRHGGSRRRT